jgi:hypothetical protein
MQESLRRARKYCHYKVKQTHAGAIINIHQAHAGAIIKQQQTAKSDIKKKKEEIIRQQATLQQAILWLMFHCLANPGLSQQEQGTPVCRPL